MRGVGIVGAALLAAVLAGCSQPPEGPTAEQRACIQREFPGYLASQKELNRCVSVCKACLGGSANSCTTSCMLQGKT